MYGTFIKNNGPKSSYTITRWVKNAHIIGFVKSTNYRLGQDPIEIYTLLFLSTIEVLMQLIIDHSYGGLLPSPTKLSS